MALGRGKEEQQQQEEEGEEEGEREEEDKEKEEKVEQEAKIFEVFVRSRGLRSGAYAAGPAEPRGSRYHRSHGRPCARSRCGGRRRTRSGTQAGRRGRRCEWGHQHKRRL